MRHREQTVEGDRGELAANPHAQSPFDGPAFCRGLLDAAPDPIVVVDERGCIVVASGETTHLFGYSREELIGKPVELLMPVRFRERHGGHRHGYAKGPHARRMGSLGSQLSGQRKDGTEFPIDVSLSPFSTADGRFVISIIRDVSARVEVERRLRHLSTHDSLTGLYNRAFFDEELARLDRGRVAIGVVVADVNGLKQVNDRLGHGSGDQLLKVAARFIGEAFRGEDIVARIGGDEFAVLVPDATADSIASAVARLQLHRGCLADDGTCSDVSLAVGCALGQPGTLQATLRAADAAMYEDKRARRP